MHAELCKYLSSRGCSSIAEITNIDNDRVCWIHFLNKNSHKLNRKELRELIKRGTRKQRKRFYE